MQSFLRRPRVLVLLGLLAAAVVAFAVAAARSGSPGCTLAAPEVNLPEQLRALGEFDQPFATGDPTLLQDASVRAATALHSDLAGAAAGDPVDIAADGSDRHDAVVVPLDEAGTDPTAPHRVVALVSFLRDCSGRAWYGDVDDLLHTDPSLLPQRFPTLGAAEAQQRLGTPTAPRLVWRTSPFQPLWLDPASGRTVAAGPPQARPT